MDIDELLRQGDPALGERGSKKFEKCAAGVAIALQEAWNVCRRPARKAVATPVLGSSRVGARVVDRDIFFSSKCGLEAAAGDEPNMPVG
jgi:hypothetical protein